MVVVWAPAAIAHKHSSNINKVRDIWPPALNSALRASSIAWHKVYVLGPLRASWCTDPSPRTSVNEVINAALN
jgi:hypothetical protein